ncbi:MAG: N-acetylglucosamine-6-phosphate deacetylase [Anaerolineae bacterium]|nr:N-acetylglucosamine-6-phosphate deacetylase [Anaerolineae bacterium]
MKTQLTHTRILTPTGVIDPGALVIDARGRVAFCGPERDAPQGAANTIALEGYIVTPGFIDIHVHGGNGITFGLGHSLAEDLRAYSAWIARHGVTGFLLSIAAPTPDLLLALISTYAGILEAGGFPGAEPLGLHLEGPFLNPAKKGAFNPTWLHAPQVDMLRAFLNAGRGWIRQVTLAPELPGAAACTALLRARSVVAALGHTDADYAVASAALHGDFTHVTHTFNAQRGLHHREPGALGAILTSDYVTAEVIADTLHVHPGAIKLLVHCLGVDRVVLITDAMAGAGLADGDYTLVGHKVRVKEGRAALEDGTLAGSTATLDQCVRNANRKAGVPLTEALQMASLNPARAMGCDDRRGSLAIGREANATVIDDDVNVLMTLVGGHIVYDARHID